MGSLILFLLCLVGPDDDSDTRAAIAIAQAQASAKPIVAPVKSKWMSYQEGATVAIALKKPLVTFIAQPPYEVPGMVVSYADALEGFPGKCSVVSAPRDGWLVWVETIPLATSVERIQAAGRKGMAVPTVDPFQRIVQASSYYQSNCGPGG